MGDDGTPLESWRITPTCRFNRGDAGAWDEAVAQLRQVYDAQVIRFGSTATLTLTITRVRGDGVPEAEYRAVMGGDRAKPCADPHPNRWHCARGTHGAVGVCPLAICGEVTNHG